MSKKWALSKSHYSSTRERRASPPAKRSARNCGVAPNACVQARTLPQQIVDHPEKLLVVHRLADVAFRRIGYPDGRPRHGGLKCVGLPHLRLQTDLACARRYDRPPRATAQASQARKRWVDEVFQPRIRSVSAARPTPRTSGQRDAVQTVETSSPSAAGPATSNKSRAAGRVQQKHCGRG